MDFENLKKGADEILNRLAQAMKNPDGSLHPQSFLCATGSLAGYSCQYDIRNEYVRGKGLTEDNVFMIVRDKQGNKFYFGELLDNLLAGDRFSVTSFVGGALENAGVKLPDVQDIFRYVSFSAGGEMFGKVRSCPTGETMDGYLKILWKPLLPTAEKYARKGETHILYGICVQKALNICVKSVNPKECGRIVLESAVSMARYSLEGNTAQ